MAIQTGSSTSKGSFDPLQLSWGSTMFGDITWPIPTIPDGATITGTTLTATLKHSMTRGSAKTTINGTTYSESGPLSFDLGTTTQTSLSVTTKGNNIFARGTVSISDIVYTVNYQYDDSSTIADPPIITIVSQDRTKISGVTGYDRCTVLFTANVELSYWEARATTTQTPGHGVGLLVESGTLAKGDTGYVYVDNEELTNGDLNYRIDIYGQNVDGVWSDD